MKHFVKIEGTFKSQAPIYCQICNKKIDRIIDFFIVEAHWNVKRKADKLNFCSTKCISTWIK